MLVAICDDTAVNRKIATKEIESIAQKRGDTLFIRNFESGDKLLQQWETIGMDVDVVLMDIVMPGLDGIATAKRLRAMGWMGELVFLTTDETSWEHAFWLDAAFYIVRGKDDEAMRESVYDKVAERIRSKHKQFVTFTCGSESVSIKVSDILFFEVMGRIMTVHYSNKKFTFYSSMAKVEEKMENQGFLRVHRSFLVAKAYIESGTRDVLRLVSGQEIPVGRVYIKDVRHYLEQSG